MKPVDDRDLRLTIRARNDDGTANGSSCSSRRRRLDERINSGGDLRSRLGARRGSGGRRRGSGGDDSLEREHLDADLRAELNSKKRGMQIEVRGDGKRRGKVNSVDRSFCFVVRFLNYLSSKFVAFCGVGIRIGITAGIITSLTQMYI